MLRVAEICFEIIYSPAPVRDARQQKPNSFAITPQDLVEEFDRSLSPLQFAKQYFMLF